MRFIPAMLLCLGFLAVSGCSKCRREASAEQPSSLQPAASAPFTVPQAVPPAHAAPAEPFGGAQLRAAAVNVQRRPHPAASGIFTTEASAGELDPGTRAAMVTAADRFMAVNVADFAIKDSARPWLDRQYVAESWTVARGPDGGLAATLRMRVDMWDEGRPAQPGQAELRLLWSGAEWALADAPREYTADMGDAIRTLQQGWNPGERSLPER